MKKLLVGMMAIGVVGGLFAAKSAIYAGEAKRVDTAQRQTQDDEDPATSEEEAAWEAWREDFAAMLEADEQYAAAEAAVDAYEGDDEEEYASLEATVDDRYRNIARLVYEQRFGAWQGTDDEFDELVDTKKKETPLQLCIAAATETCGTAGVKSVTVAQEHCSFECYPPQPVSP